MIDTSQASSIGRKSIEPTKDKLKNTTTIGDDLKQNWSALDAFKVKRGI